MADSDDEARDERGRWTASGVGAHPTGAFMSVSKPENYSKADMIALRRGSPVSKNFKQGTIKVKPHARGSPLY